MRKVWKGLVAGMCVAIISYSSVSAGIKPSTDEMPAGNTSGMTVMRPVTVKLIETNTNPFAQKNLVVEMRDMVGKYIYTSGAAGIVNGQPVVDADLPPLAKGVYIFSVYDEQDKLVATGKYVKE